MTTQSAENTGLFYTSERIRKVKAVYNMIIGQRSFGKTYDMGYHIIEDYWNARENSLLVQAAYFRRYDTDLKSMGVRTTFKNLECNAHGENVIAKITDGEFDRVVMDRRAFYLAKIDQNTGNVKKDNNPFMFAMALNTYMHDKSGGFPYVKTIWFEEFMEVNEYGYLPGEFKIFLNCISTVIRKRSDVTIWMTGNTMDPLCPYFSDMGLTRVNTQKLGTIDTYKLGKSGKCIAVERTVNSKHYKESQFNNDYYFAFDNNEIKMITEGSWAIGAFPLLMHDLKPSDVCGRFFVLYKEATLQCDVVSTDTEAFIYVHTDMDPLDPIDEQDDLIYSLEYSPKSNYRRRLDIPLTEVEKVIQALIRSDKMFFDSNMTGHIMMTYRKNMVA